MSRLQRGQRIAHGHRQADRILLQTVMGKAQQIVLVGQAGRGEADVNEAERFPCERVIH